MHQPYKFKVKNILSAILTLILICSVTRNLSAFHTSRVNFYSPLTNLFDTVPPVKIDSAAKIKFEGSDTIPPNNTTDSAKLQVVDSFSLKLSKDTLSAPVHYFAEDSVVTLIRSKKIKMYGKTKTEYTDITLTAPTVEINQATSVLTAVRSVDSVGATADYANFKQSENEFNSDTIRYNFKTQKGLTKNTISEQGEFFVHMEDAKKVDAATTFARRGFFTTCNLDHPHFGFRAGKLKLVNQKLAVTGPVHPEFEDVPVPIYLPFGFFPLNQGRRGGFIAPSFETNDYWGIGLTGGGYYLTFNNNDRWDARITGDIYSYGGWALNINPSYRKRYRYSGSFNLGYRFTKNNFKGDADYSAQHNYSIVWSHATDPRSRPGTTFNASVNASSTRYNQNIPNNTQQNLLGNMGSSITYTKAWVDKPFNLTVSGNHQQNNQTNTVTIGLPDIAFSVGNVYPFQKEDYSGPRKWYHQLSIAYQGNFRNAVTFNDTVNSKEVYGKSFFAHLLDTLQWGAQHNIPITVALPSILNGAVQVAPSVSYSQVWLNKRTQYRWNDVLDTLETDVTKGFFIDQQASFGLSFNTSLFGTFNFKKGKVKAMRHVIRPTLSVNYRPDLSKQYYSTVQIDTNGNTNRFSQFVGNVYGGYGEGRFGGMNFGIDNNLEMKVRRKKPKDGDTTTTATEEDPKVRLIDGLSITSAYNFFADSMKLSPFNLSFRTTLFEKINITAGGLLDPYEVNAIGQRVNKLYWKGSDFKIGRLANANVSMSTSFQSKPKDPEKEKKKQEYQRQQINDPLLAAEQQRLLEYMRQNPAEFVDFNIPWSININYSLTYTNQFNTQTAKFDNIFTNNASFTGSFNLTPKWNFSVNGYYNISNTKLETFSMAISRDLHCWQMAINVTPLGPFRFFNFTISPKSSLLQDLKVNRTRTFQN